MTSSPVVSVAPFSSTAAAAFFFFDDDLAVGEVPSLFSVLVIFLLLFLLLRSLAGAALVLVSSPIVVSTSGATTLDDNIRELAGLGDDNVRELAGFFLTGSFVDFDLFNLFRLVPMRSDDDLGFFVFFFLGLSSLVSVLPVAATASSDDGFAIGTICSTSTFPTTSSGLSCFANSFLISSSSTDDTGGFSFFFNFELGIFFDDLFFFVVVVVLPEPSCFGCCSCSSSFVSSGT